MKITHNHVKTQRVLPYAVDTSPTERPVFTWPDPTLHHGWRVHGSAGALGEERRLGTLRKGDILIRPRVGPFRAVTTPPTRGSQVGVTPPHTRVGDHRTVITPPTRGSRFRISYSTPAAGPMCRSQFGGSSQPRSPTHGNPPIPTPGLRGDHPPGPPTRRVPPPGPHPRIPPSGYLKAVSAQLALPCAGCDPSPGASLLAAALNPPVTPRQSPGASSLC
nr:PREDICTED: formin-like protein 5 [Struthio camelus australis]